MIKKFGLKYIAVIGSLAFLFSQFIACGAQFYKVSLEDDVSPPPGASVSPTSLDPSSPSFGIHAPSGWQKLPIEFYTGRNLNKDQVEQLRVAMATWEWTLGWKQGELFKYKGVQQDVSGDSFPDLYSSLEDGINGHYADFDWSKTAKNVQVLATTIWANAENLQTAISGADIRFNTENYHIGDSYYIMTDGKREVVDMLSLALHELGHLLGLNHIDENEDAHSVMNPRLFIGEGLAQRSLSPGDISRIQNIYKCRGDACDVDYLMTQVQPSEKYDSQSNKPNFALTSEENTEEAH